MSSRESLNGAGAGLALIDVHKLAELIAAALAQAVSQGALELPGKPPVQEEPDQQQLVTLNQAAAIVNRSKHCLRAYEDLPPPTIEGRRGQPHLWDWQRIRPWLEARFGRKLPQRFPSF